MCTPAIIPLAAAVIGAGTAVYSADQQRQAQHEAQKRQKADATARFQRHLYEMRHPEITEDSKQ